MDQLHNPRPHGAASKSTVSNVLTHVTAAGNSVISLLSGLLAAVLILYSGYVLYDTFYTQTNAGNSWELLQYRPEIIDDGATPLSGNNTLAVVNEDYRAWLTLYNTNIDYPVMQADDDLYYASHDVYGNVSLTGAIYLAAGNTRGMSDSYNLIYGHHMDNKAMFGALDSFTSASYFNSHREGVLVSSSGVYDLTVFAVAETDAYESQLYSVGNRAAEVLAFLRSPGATTRTVFFDEAAAQGADRIVALSTCAAAETNGRLIVFAKMTRHELITLTATGYGDTYDAQAHGLRNVTTNYPEGTTFTYSTDGGATWSTTPPTRTNVGTTVVIVRATHPIYGTTETTETIQINPARVTVRVLDAAKTAGADDPTFRAVVTGLVDDQEIIYIITRPGAGTDEDAGSYEGAIIATGEEVQGNYLVTYVPGNLTITAATETLEDADTPLAQFFSAFQPRGSRSGAAWALINLICLLITIYILLPLMHLRAKFRRRKEMQSFDEQHEETDEGYYDVERFTRRFRIGIGTELVDVIAAVVAFLLTEDMRLPMILVDRWTPLMILFMAVCWVLDVRLVRYRDKAKAKEEETAAAV